MTLVLSGVTTTRGNVEYQVKIGSTVKCDWNTSTTCNITGLTSGTAYAITVNTRTSSNINIVGPSKTATIYTSKEVTSSATTLTGTCPSTNNKTIAATDIYNGTTLTGTCSQIQESCTATSTATSVNACPTGTSTVSCNGYSTTATGTTCVNYSSSLSSVSYYDCGYVSIYSSNGCIPSSGDTSYSSYVSCSSMCTSLHCMVYSAVSGHPISYTICGNYSTSSTIAATSASNYCTSSCMEPYNIGCSVRSLSLSYWSSTPATCQSATTCAATGFTCSYTSGYALCVSGCIAGTGYASLCSSNCKSGNYGCTGYCASYNYVTVTTCSLEYYSSYVPVIAQCSTNIYNNYYSRTYTSVIKYDTSYTISYTNSVIKPKNSLY